MDKINISRRLLGLSALVLYFNIFFFRRLGPVSFSLQILGLLFFLIYIFWNKKSLPKMKWTIVGFSLSIFWGMITLILRTNGMVAGIYYWFNLALLGYLSYLLATDIPFFRSLLEFKLAPFNFLISYMGSGLKLLGQILSGEIATKGKESPNAGKLLNTVKPIIVGLLLSLPVLFILINLLRGADPIYASYVNRIVEWVNNILKGSFWNDISGRAVMSTILLIIFSPFLLLFRKKDFHPPFSLPKKDLLVGEMTVVSGLVAVTLGSFLFIQWPYIFAKVAFETDLSKYGVATYSEYVKRGFGELLAVTFIVYILAWINLYILRNRKLADKIFSFHAAFSSTLCIIQMVLFAEFFLFILSIFRRVYLYQTYHGWSLGRIYGSMLLIWITGMVVILFWRHFQVRRFIKYELIFTLAIIVFFGFFNAESFIVTSHPPTVNKKIDYVYLSRMSPDGFIGWQKAYQYAQKVLLDSNLLNKKEITRDDRREIAYSGIIIRSLLSKYQLLIDEYGSTNEKQIFYSDLFANLQKITVDAIKVMPKKDDYKIDYLNGTNGRITDTLKKLSSSKPDIDSIASSLFMSFHPEKVTFDLTNDGEYLFYGLAVPENKNRRKVEAIDKIFNWNFGRNRVYQMLKNEINYKSLLDLQYRHYELYKLIIKNNSGDTSYDTDISFDTPFLERI